jgi:hypothetical protein
MALCFYEIYGNSYKMLLKARPIFSLIVWVKAHYTAIQFFLALIQNKSSHRHNKGLKYYTNRFIDFFYLAS